MALKKMKEYKTLQKHFSRFFQNPLKFLFVSTTCILTYFFPRILLTGPVYIGWNITFNCMCKCDFCKSSDFYKKDKELNTAECIRIIRQIAKSGVCLLSITGGEPLLRNDLFKIIAEAKKYGISINLITNGYLLEEKAEMIIKSGIDTVTVSIDSLFEKEHDLLRKCPGLFKKAKKGIEKLQNIKTNKPNIIVTSVVNKKNYKYLNKFVKYWSDKKVTVTLQPIQENSSKSIFKVKNKDLLFLDSDKTDFNYSYQKLLKKYPFFRIGYEKEFVNFFFDKKRFRRKYKCFAGFFMAQIDAFGNVYPCPEFIECFGTLKKESFKNIWKSQKAYNFRNKLKKFGCEYFCWYKCTGTINYYLTNLLKLI